MAHFEAEVWDKKTKQLVKGKIYIDGKLNQQIDTKIKKDVTKKDKDKVYVIDGTEGAGKSVLAMQLAKKLDHTFCLDRVVMNAIDFTHAIAQAKRFQCIVFDEAYSGLSSRTALSEINHLLVSLMMEMRQKNLFVIIVLPTIFLLDKYVALWRARGLFHVYEFKGNRGFWVYYNNKKKKVLYLLGKKDYSYNIKNAKSKFKGRFLDAYVVDEAEYRKKKKKALESRDRRTKSDKFKEQRDKLLWILYENEGHTLQELIDICKMNQVHLKKTSISEILSKFRATGT